MQRPGDVEMWLKVATSAEIVSVACHISRSEILGLLSAFWVILSSRNQLQLREVFKNKIPKFTCAEFLDYYLYLHAPEAAPLSSSPGMWLRRWCLEYLLENSLLLRIFVPITVPKSYSGQKERKKGSFWWWDEERSPSELISAFSSSNPIHFKLKIRESFVQLTSNPGIMTVGVRATLLNLVWMEDLLFFSDSDFDY